MPTTKPTPGPWTARERARTLRARGMFYVATTDIWAIEAPTEPTPDEDEANARAIAALPELLEACNAAMEFLEDVEKGMDFHGDDALYQQLRAAIAKATKP